jgi:hypothetical protein
MFDPKTHFDQVPVEIVKKMVEEQALTDATSEPDQGIEEETLSEVLSEMKAQSIAMPLTLAQQESLN